jgi:hypothetical protein
MDRVELSLQPQFPMFNALSQLNYVAVLVTAVAGFLIGWLWFSPVLFAKPWMAEMKITEEMMKAQCAEKGMAGFMIKGFIYTLISTFAVAVVIQSRPVHSGLRGAAIGAFVGLLLVGARMLNGAVWEQRSTKLMAIVIGHEVVLFAVQGAILGAWL